MMEIAILLLFCAALIGCVVLHAPVLYALIGGLFLFVFYAKYKGHSWRVLTKAALGGIQTVKNVVIIMVLVGMLTASWRMSGTVAVVVCWLSRLLHPACFVLMAFLLNCLMSVLTGTAFGTVATMGVTCMAVAASMEIDPLIAGGAIFSGIFFGDRCSPVSSSAVLVSEVTKSNLYTNLKNMCRSALVPFLLCCVIYTLLGFLDRGMGAGLDVQSLYSQAFSLHWLAVLPGVAVIVLSVLRLDVKITMAVSILCALLLAIFLQGMEPLAALKTLVVGFAPAQEALAALLGGGGIVSMLNVVAIICISCLYAGLFRLTGLLNGIQNGFLRWKARITPYGATACVAAVSAAVCCNQTLSILLTQQLCQDERSAEQMALDLEDSAVLMAPWFPWSVAAAVPLSTIGAAPLCLLFACYLYLVPLWRLAVSLWQKKGKCKGKTTVCGAFSVDRANDHSVQ